VRFEQLTVGLFLKFYASVNFRDSNALTQLVPIVVRKVFHGLRPTLGLGEVN
jgi:hypothetical protein